MKLIRIASLASLSAGVLALVGCTGTIMMAHSTRKFSVHNMDQKQLQTCLGLPSAVKRVNGQEVWVYVQKERPAPNLRHYKPTCTTRVYWKNGRVTKATYNGMGFLQAMSKNQCYGARRSCRRVKN